MMRNDYRRSLILLRSNASGYSGHVRLERRTLMGTMYFLVQSPGDCPALRAALVGRGRDGSCYACALGELQQDARGQAVLGYTFDPRDICRRELEQYQLIAITCAGDESCQVVLFGNVCGHAELNWESVRSALCALYAEAQPAPAPEPQPETAAQAEPEIQPVPAPEATPEARAQAEFEIQTDPAPVTELPEAAGEPSAAQVPTAEEITSPQEDVTQIVTKVTEAAQTDGAPGKGARAGAPARAREEPQAAEAPRMIAIGVEVPQAEASPADAAGIAISDPEAILPGAAQTKAVQEEAGEPAEVQPEAVREETGEPVAAQSKAVQSGASASGAGESLACELLEARGVRTSAPWPGAAEALRPLFQSEPALTDAPDDQCVYVEAPMPEGSGFPFVAAGLLALGGALAAIRYALPAAWSEEPPAGLEDCAWIGDQNAGWWVTEVPLDN